jgi:predicted  nucleic acid-binding Zn-ribbon protein
MDLRKPWQGIVELAKNAKLIPLYSKNEYTNSRDRLPYMCAICGEIEFKMLINIQKGRGCILCGNQRGFQKQRKPMVQLIKEANLVHARPLFTHQEYGGLYQRMPYSCRLCSFEWVAFPKNIGHGQGCPRCGREKSASHKRRDFSKIQADAKLLNLEPLFKEKEYLRGSLSYRY